MLVLVLQVRYNEAAFVGNAHPCCSSGHPSAWGCHAYVGNLPFNLLPWEGQEIGKRPVAVLFG